MRSERIAKTRASLFGRLRAHSGAGLLYPRGLWVRRLRAGPATERASFDFLPYLGVLKLPNSFSPLSPRLPSPFPRPLFPLPPPFSPSHLLQNDASSEGPATQLQSQHRGIDTLYSLHLRGPVFQKCQDWSEL